MRLLQCSCGKTVAKVPGVTSVTVSLLTNSMNVEGTAAPSDIIQAVTQAGYGASLQGGEQNTSAPAFDEEALKDHETPKLQETSDRFCCDPDSINVCFHGTYDVELAASVLYGGKSCGHGIVSDASDHSDYDH